MKKLSTIILMSIALLAGACKESSKKMEGDVVIEKNHESKKDNNSEYVLNKNAVSFKDKHVMPKLFDAYQMIAQDLVNDDFIEARKHVANLLQSVQDDEDSKWNRLKQVIDSLSTTEDLNSFRVGFLDLSRIMESHLREELTNGEFYKQYCPMAFNNKGAFWFASDEEIMNPYFGDAMLHCGEVRETIKAE